jgi:hypothetical protein
MRRLVLAPSQARAHAALVLVAGADPALGHGHIDAVQEHELVAHGFERRRRGLEDEVSLASGGPPIVGHTPLGLNTITKRLALAT